MTDAPSTSEVSFACDLDAPPDKVWRAVTEPDLRAAWLGEAEARACEVIEADPPERLVLGWTLDEPASTVTIEIEPRDGGSRLTITHRPAAEIVALPRRRVDPVMRAMAWRLAA
ncbi:MAG TPA: SRPBCC domain-containing protein [Caulobacteraceae bacterium]|jgi:uncharacterized protein YndB with AHSA1/START domain